MQQPQVVHCNDCIFFKKFKTGNTFLGYCQINAPVIWIQGDKMNKNGHFPIMAGEDFCGQGEIAVDSLLKEKEN